MACSVATSARAATPPVPSITITKVEKGTPVRKNDTAGKDDEVPRSGPGNSTITTKTTSDRGEVNYTISLHNFSTYPAKDLVVEYHFYNITRSTGKSSASNPVITEVKATETLDIDPGKTRDVETKPVPYEMTQVQTTTTTPYGYAVSPVDTATNGYTVTPNNVKTTNSTNSTNTTMLGWHIEIRYNGKVIKTDDQPSDLPDKLKDFYHYKPDDKSADKPPAKTAA
jgi:hypothetical protein